MQSIADIIRYQEGLLSSNPTYPRTPLSKRITPLKINQTVASQLPNSYLEFVKNYEVENVAVGSMTLKPLQGIDIFDMIANLNGEMRNPCIPEDLLHVANFEADLILIKDAQKQPDNEFVYFLDISSGFFPGEIKIASNFEKFVIISSIIHQMSIKDQMPRTSSVIEEIRIIDGLLDEKSLACWGNIFEMVA